MSAPKPLARPSWINRTRPLWVVGATLSVGLLVGCVAPPDNAAESPDSPDVEETMPPEMVPQSVSDRVLAQAADDLKVPQAELSLLRFNQEVWRDGCLGLGQANESCLQALVEGWQLEVVYGEESYFYRADSDGDIIRPSTLDNNLPPSVSEKVLAIAATDSGLPLDQLAVTAAEPRVWDGCLGIAAPGTACTQIAIFGWRAVVEGGGQTLIYHTDMTGDDIRWNNL